jgi:hypothetical protein
MIHFMLGAFIPAGLTNLGAEAAELSGKYATTCHELNSEAANIRARAIKRDALCHHFDLLFL